MYVQLRFLSYSSSFFLQIFLYVQCACLNYVEIVWDALLILDKSFVRIYLNPSSSNHLDYNGGVVQYLETLEPWGRILLSNMIPKSLSNIAPL